MQSTARQVGSALGIAILGTVLFPTLANRFDSALTDLGVPEAQRVQLVDAVESSAGAVIPGLAANPATATVAAARGGRLHRRHPAVCPRGGRLPRHRAGREPVSRRPTPASIG